MRQSLGYTTEQQKPLSPDFKESLGRGQRNAVVIRGRIRRYDEEHEGREEKAAEFSRDPQSSGCLREEKGKE